MSTLILNFFFLIKTRSCQLKVLKYIFIKKDKFGLHLRMINKNCSNLASARDLVPIFFFSIRRIFSPALHREPCKKVDGFRLFLRQMIFYGEFSGFCLQRALVRWLAAWNLERVWPEYDFSTLAEFLRSIRWVSQWVS